MNTHTHTHADRLTCCSHAGFIVSDALALLSRVSALPLNFTHLVIFIYNRIYKKSSDSINIKHALTS